MWSALTRAARILSRRPIFAAVSILALALGIGLNTACYSLVRAVLLKPLPYSDPARLTYIWETHPRFPVMAVAYPDYLDWKRATALEGIAAYTIQTMNRGILLGQGTPVPVQAVMASHELFPLLGIRPLLGRALSSADEREKGSVAVISEKLWRTRFGANPAVIGQAIRLEQSVLTVVGVVEDRYAFPAWADLWMPLSLLEPQLQSSRKFHTVEVVARLKPEISPATAQQELEQMMANLAAEHPGTNGNESATLVPLQAYLTDSVHDALLLVWGAVGLVLLIIAVNVAHLVLARTDGRARELAIRVALGATRRQIAHVLLTENLLLAVCGAAAGLGLAVLLLPAASNYAAARLPRFEPLTLDANIAAFSLLAAVATAILFSIPALWMAFRARITTTRGPLGRILIGVEIALAFLVLSGAGLLVRSFDRLLAVDPGFQTSELTAINVLLPRPAYDWDKSRLWFEQRLAPRVRSLPGVRAVANGNVLPLTLPGTDQVHRFATRFGVPGESYKEGAYPVAQIRWVSQDYFRAMGIPLRSGRLLTESDFNLPRYVISETLARRYFPGQDAAGKQLVLGVADPKQTPVEIVGVVADVRDLSLELPPEPVIYSLNTSMQFALLVDGTGVNTEAIAAAVRELEPDALIERAGPFREVIRESLTRRTFALQLMTGFAAIAALLAALGIFGVVSYTAGRRMKEFGLRMALGARPADVRRLILRETGIVVAAGLAAGAIGSYWLAPMGRSLLYGVEPSDPLAFTASAAGMLLTSMIAAWLPAWKAARLDPSAALREEEG